MWDFVAALAVVAVLFVLACAFLLVRERRARRG
jgi:hypothetical protein